MATDDGAANIDLGMPSAERAIKVIAALHDAIQANPVPRAGEKADVPAAERLAWLLIQDYNHLLDLAVRADARFGTRIRFEVVRALEAHQEAIAEIGLRRNGEGGLSLWSPDFAAALRERPISTLKVLRNAAGACAGLVAFVQRSLAGIGDPGRGVNPDVGTQVPPQGPGAPRIWRPEPPAPTVRVATFRPGQYGLQGADKALAQEAERPQYYA